MKVQKVFEVHKARLTEDIAKITDFFSSSFIGKDAKIEVRVVIEDDSLKPVHGRSGPRKPK